MAESLFVHRNIAQQVTPIGDEMSCQCQTLLFETGKYKKGACLVPLAQAPLSIRPESIVEGAIVLVVGGVEVLDEELWDLIEEYWYSMIALCEELMDQGSGRISLPDQNRVVLHGRTLADGRLELVLDPPPEAPELARRATGQLREALGAILEEGERFFLHMLNCAGSAPEFSSWTDMVERIRAAKERAVRLS